MGSCTHLAVLEGSTTELDVVDILLMEQLDLSQHVIKPVWVHMIGGIDLDTDAERLRHFPSDGANNAKNELNTFLRAAAVFVYTFV